MAKQTKQQAVEQRSQQRPVASEAEGLAARKEAAQRGVETRKRNREAQLAEVAAKHAELKKHEAKLVAETRKMLEAEATAEAKAQAEQPRPAPTAPQAANGKQPQAQGAERQTKRPEATTAQKERAGGPMATVALRGEEAVRFRALAAARGVSLARLLVQMIEAFEEQAG